MQSSDNDSNKKKKKRKNLNDDSEMPKSDSIILENDRSSSFRVEEIVQDPIPGYEAPTSIGFSPDDNVIAYLFSPDGSLKRRVFAFDLRTSEPEPFFSPPNGVEEQSLSSEEKLRRERVKERGLVVTRYEWVNTSSDRKSIMVPLPTGIYFKDLYGSEPELKLPSTSSSPIIDPHMSPCGTMLSFIRDSELHVLNLVNNELNQLTHGALGDSLTHGLSEYIAQEEMDRKSGYWWSPDSKYIAFTEVDISEIPLFTITHHGKSSVGPDAREDHAYPFAGASNAKLRLGVVPSSSSGGGPTKWMNLLCGGEKNPENEYLARVNWMPGNVLTAQILNRSHTKLTLVAFDIESGEKRVFLEEENETWVNLHYCFAPLEGGGFVWASERTGFRHLYLYGKDGNLAGAITGGEDWMVENIAGVDEVRGSIYFTGTCEGPLETHLYRAELFLRGQNRPPESPVRVSRGKGKHVIAIDRRMRSFVDVHDSLEHPPKVSLCSLRDGSVILPLYDRPFAHDLRLDPPEIVRIRAGDGSSLYGALYKPDRNEFGAPPYRSMISVYGGPTVQRVRDSWKNTVDMRAQFLRSKGVLVFKLDNRGSAGRGITFEGALKHKFGQTDAVDQLAGAEWLISEGLSLRSRLGLYGWSYGGFLSAISLARFPSTFQLAVAGAPVTSWDGYDTFYTEKYLGSPTEDPGRRAHELASVLRHVSGLAGKLLLVHGMIDENVHFRHTARLVGALVAAGKHYELLVFPEQRHVPRGFADRVYMEMRIWDFINANL